MSSLKGKYLTFLLGNEEYGIQILKVKEIIGMMEYTIIPKTPKFVKGVINLRGKIIPILDLRLKFELEEKEYDKITCIIVVEVEKEGNKKQIGIIVDTVSEVLNIQGEEVESPKDYGVEIEGDFLLGIGKLKSKVVMLMDIERVVSIEELSILSQVEESVEDV